MAAQIAAYSEYHSLLTPDEFNVILRTTTDEFNVIPRTNDVLSFSVGVFLRTEIYLPVLDKDKDKDQEPSELYRRFSGENQKILRAVEVFIPGKESFLFLKLFSQLPNIIKQMLKTLLWNCAK